MLTITNPAPLFRTRAQGAGLLALVCCLMACAAHAQRYTPPPPPLTTAPCVPTKKDPCTQPAPPPPDTTERFPFPGDTPGDTSGASPKPAPNTQTPADSSKQQAFPFPEEDSAKSSVPAAAAGASSSSSSSDTTPDDHAGKDDASSDTAPASRFSRHKIAKVQDKQSREAEDLEVSRYYASTGDYNAAYLRAKDAVASYAEDPEAHFTLAEMAEHLKKKDEAEAEYRQYLKLEPDGDHITYVAHALERLAANTPDPSGKKAR